MSCTNEDLKRIKDKCLEPWNQNQTRRINILGSDMDALLARLEAVERYARDMAAEYPDRFPQEYEAWLKTTGELSARKL